MKTKPEKETICECFYSDPPCCRNKYTCECPCRDCFCLKRTKSKNPNPERTDWEKELNKTKYNLATNEVKLVLDLIDNARKQAIRETAKEILKEIEYFKLKDFGEVVAYKLGASGFRTELEEYISEKYQIRYKHKKKGIKNMLNIC